jgi:hypothetical protein
MKINFMNADLGNQPPFHINLNEIFFRDDRGIPMDGERPPCDPDTVGNQDPESPVGDADPPTYAELGGDEIKDDYPYPDDPPTENPQGYPPGS